MTFRRNKIRIPKSMGSVGRYISKPKPGNIRLNSTERGAAKTATHISLSNEKITKRATPSKTGKMFNTIISFFTTNQAFSRINPIETR
jgi:hypothetical protein